MLTASRLLALNSQAGPPLPQVPELRDLYAVGTTPRKNDLTMIVGRPGHQKSSFALWWLAQMGLTTLYFSADMSGFEASVKLVCMLTGRTLAQVETGIKVGSVDINTVLKDVRMIFDPAKPITWHGVAAATNAYVELFNGYPEAFVFDNLMDFEGGEADYGVQMENLQIMDELKGETGSNVFVLHHATDKGDRAQRHPHLPPARGEVKGGLAEKPQLTLGVAIDPGNLNFHIATLKQSMGPSDQSGEKYITLRADPERNMFRPL